MDSETDRWQKILKHLFKKPTEVLGVSQTNNIHITQDTALSISNINRIHERSKLTVIVQVSDIIVKILKKIPQHQVIDNSVPQSWQQVTTWFRKIL